MTCAGAEILRTYLEDEVMAKNKYIVAKIASNRVPKHFSCGYNGLSITVQIPRRKHDSKENEEGS